MRVKGKIAQLVTKGTKAAKAIKALTTELDEVKESLSSLVSEPGTYTNTKGDVLVLTERNGKKKPLTPSKILEALKKEGKEDEFVNVVSINEKELAKFLTSEKIEDARPEGESAPVKVWSFK